MKPRNRLEMVIESDGRDQQGNTDRAGKVNMPQCPSLRVVDQAGMGGCERAHKARIQRWFLLRLNWGENTDV